MPCNSLAKELIFYLLINQKTKGQTYFVAALIETLIESLDAAQVAQSKIFTEHLEGKVSDLRIRTSLKLINENLSEIVLSRLARESGLSLRNFNRLFLGATGLTPKNYLMRRRVARAKELLKESQLTVTDIAMEVGYQSLSKFIETFKRFEGVLPSDFRAAEKSLPQNSRR